MERERKRKLPSRAARVESVSKKRTSTPPEPRTQSHPTPPPPPASVVEEALPKSITNGKPLPSVEEPQPDDLPSRYFQTISESGVLEESLKRSRARWLSEGIFERYWVKPTKKKGVVEPPNNPPKESMTKLGTCQIKVEPHVFEAQMFAIKEPTPKLPTGPLQQSMYRPIIQYGPPNGVMPPPAPIPPPVQQTPLSPPQAPPIPQDTPMASSSSSPLNTDTQVPSAAHLNGTNGQSSTPFTQLLPAQPTAAPVQPVGAKDPVIQMLAERAASDDNLKDLMKNVAKGEATPEELKRFQNHIDELTKLQKARQGVAASPPAPPAAAPAMGHKGEPSPSPQHGLAPIVRTPLTPPPPIPGTESAYKAQAQALRSKGPLPSTKSEISGIAFEFNGGSGDRFLFPKFSILEYLPQGEVVASFLIVRKGSSSDSPKYDPELDYYQPITIRLYPHQPRQLDALQKIVAPPDEVRRYMDDIMDNVTRAEYVLLAMRLPRDSSETNHQPKEEESEIKNGAYNNQVLWATTNPPTPPVIKQVEKVPPTDEEKYRNFIATVS